MRSVRPWVRAVGAALDGGSASVVRSPASVSTTLSIRYEVPGRLFAERSVNGPVSHDWSSSRRAALLPIADADLK